MAYMALLDVVSLFLSQVSPLALRPRSSASLFFLRRWPLILSDLMVTDHMFGQVSIVGLWSKLASSVHVFPMRICVSLPSFFSVLCATGSEQR